MIACSLRTVVSTYLIFMYSGCRPNLYQRGCNRLEGGEIVNPFMSCPIVLSSFSCFQSNFFVIPSLFSVSSYFFKSQFLSFLCFPVNKYSAYFEVLLKAIYPSSFFVFPLCTFSFWFVFDDHFGASVVIHSQCTACPFQFFLFFLVLHLIFGCCVFLLTSSFM